MSAGIQPLVRVSRPAMGSNFEILLAGGEVESLQEAGFAALDRVGWLERQLSHFEPDSDICRINRTAHKEPAAVAPNLMGLLVRLRRLSAETGGAFDPTAGRLVRLFGFARRGALSGQPVEPPDPELVAQTAAQIGWRHVELDEDAGTIRYLTPEIELHLGAVGKGFVVQCAADYLRARGVATALLHSGHSSLVAIGHPPDAAGWRIGIADPRDESRAAAVTSLCDCALSTSSPIGQTVSVNGARVGHLFDPRTGQPLVSCASVSVISPDGAECDALSTAFAVLGIDRARSCIGRMPGVAALFLCGGHGDGWRADRIGDPTLFSEDC